MSLADRLYQKGWTSQEIAHALHHLQLAEEKKRPLVRFSEVSTYWLLLVGIIISIISLSQLLFPFLKLVPNELAFIIIAILGSVFGILYAHVLHNIDTLTERHHAVTLVLTVVIALAWSHRVSGSILFGSVFSGLFVLLYGYYWFKK